MYLTKGRQTKMTDSQVREIIELRASGHSINRIAKMFKVNRGTIYWYTDPNFRAKARTKIKEDYAKKKTDPQYVSEQKKARHERYMKVKSEWNTLSDEQKRERLLKQVDVLLNVGKKKLSDYRIEKIMKGEK